MRAAPLLTVSSRRPSGERAEPSGPWKPGAVLATPNASPAGRTCHPVGVTIGAAGLGSACAALAAVMVHATAASTLAILPLLCIGPSWGRR